MSFNESGQNTACGDVIGCVSSRDSDVTGMIIMAAITILTMTGNSAVCWVIYSDTCLWTIPNRFVLNLAVCDLMTAVLNAPFTLVAQGYNGWVLGQQWCEVNGFLTTLFGVASVVNLSAISVNRCFLIVYPKLYSSFCTPACTNCIITGGWVFSALCAVPPLFHWSRYTYIPGKAICTILWSTDVTYTLAVLTGGVLLPFLIMILAYVKIFTKVRDSRRKIFSHIVNKNVDEATETGTSRCEPHTTGAILQPTDEPDHPADSNTDSRMDGFSLDVDSHTDSVNKLTSPDSSLSRRVLRRRMSKTFHRHSSVDSGHSDLFVVNELPQSMASVHYNAYLPEDLIDSGHSLTITDCLFSSTNSPSQLTAVENSPSSCSPRRHSLATPRHIHARQRTARVRSISESCIQRPIGTRPVTWVLEQPINERGSDHVTSLPEPTLSHGMSKSQEVRLTATLLIVVFVFTASWAPLSVVNVLETFTSYTIPRSVDRITIYLVFLQSAINPVIYGAMNRNFKKGFKKILRRLCHAQ